MWLRWCRGWCSCTRTWWSFPPSPARLSRPSSTSLRAALLARSSRASMCCTSSPGSDWSPGRSRGSVNRGNGDLQDVWSDGRELCSPRGDPTFLERAQWQPCSTCWRLLHHQVDHQHSTKKYSEITSCPIIIRYSMAAIVNATNQFKNIFNSSGYLLIMPSLVQVPIVLLHHHHEFKRSVNPQQVSLLVQIFRQLIRSGCLCCRSYTRSQWECWLCYRSTATTCPTCLSPPASSSWSSSSMSSTGFHWDVESTCSCNISLFCCLLSLLCTGSRFYSRCSAPLPTLSMSPGLAH